MRTEAKAALQQSPIIGSYSRAEILLAHQLCQEDQLKTLFAWAKEPKLAAKCNWAFLTS